MAEDSRRAPSGAALSKSDQVVPRPLDLRSWQGLTDVLSRAREAGLSESAYAEFRDLVLQYAQRGGDQTLLKEIETAVASFSKSDKPPVTESNTPQAKTAQQSVQQTPTPFARRPVPTFMPLHVGTYPDLPSTEAPLSPPPPSDSTPTPALATDSPTAQTTQPIITAPQAFAAPPPASTNLSLPTSTDPAPATPPATVTAVTETPPAHELKSLEEHKARIAEIKRLINTSVGNPATLMDQHNSRGRDYMAALLSAMKASATGGAPLESAMQLLETTHRALLEQHAEPIPPPQAESVPPAEQSSLQPTTSITTTPTTATLTTESRLSVPPLEPIAVTTKSEPEPEQQPAARALEPEPKPTVTPRVPFVALPNRLQTAPNGDSVNVAAQFEPPLTNPDVPTTSSTETTTQNQELVTGWTEPEPTISNPITTIPTVQPVAQVPPTVSATTSAQPPVPLDDSSVRQTDLTSPEVTTSLNQLLGEWNIFASSGLFGIGPGGAEHPLYRRLAALTMGEVMAGRWEQATPEIRRTITDYVNAWRHEQAIAYNPSETFEHYLRRVVFRILKRQRG